MDRDDTIRTSGDVHRSRTDDAQRKGLITGLVIGVIGGGVLGGIIGAVMADRPSVDPRRGTVIGAPEQPIDRDPIPDRAPAR